MPVELFSTTTRQTYGLPVQTMTVPIDGHPNWGEAMEVRGITPRHCHKKSNICWIAPDSIEYTIIAGFNF